MNLVYILILIRASLCLQFNSYEKNQPHPVCIIGGGITGLTLAHKYKDLGLNYIIFEKQAQPGGKANTWRDPSNYYQADMGPLLFSKNSTNSLKLFRKLGFETIKVPHATFTAFALGTSVKVKKTPPEILYAQQRYFQIRRKIKLEPGNLNFDNTLHISLGLWLMQHNLHALIPPCQIMVTASGYGSVFETPALYGLRILDEHGILSDKLYTVKEGLDKVFLEYAKGLNIRLSTKVNRIYSNTNVFKNPGVQYESSKGLGFQHCSKVITAFPPLYSTFKKMMGNLNHPIMDVLKYVRISKYASFAIINYKLQDYAYFPFLKLTPEVNMSELPGTGRIAGMLKQRHVYSGYIWIRGSFKRKATREEINNMIPQLRIDIDTLTNTRNHTRITNYKNWEYFPHVTSKSLDDHFYKKLHKVQGKGQLYIAGPLLTFETIHNSIDAANFMFKTYLQPRSSIYDYNYYYRQL